MLPSDDFIPLPFESSGELTEKYIKKAEIELNETPEIRSQKIKELRALVEANKTLETFLDRDDKDFITFLRCKKFDVRRAYDHLNYYASYQKRFNFMFTNLNSEEYLKTGAFRWVTFLPYRTPDGCAIMVFKMDNWNASEVSLKELQRFYCFFAATTINDPMTQINGYQIIMDFSGNYMQYIRNITPISVYIIYNGTVHCLPGRIKGIHIVHPQLAFKICYTLMKPFLTQKIKSRMFMHDSSKTLLQHFPKQVLPVEYGGDIKEYSNMEWIKKNSTPEKLDGLFAK